MTRLAATDRLHGEPGLESGTEGATRAHGGSPFQGRRPASEVNDGACPEKSDHLKTAQPRGDVAGPDPCRREPGGQLPRWPSPGADPDGDRWRQALHRHLGDLPAFSGDL